jgi:transcriptional regulator with XRE-family HTH domain
LTQKQLAERLETDEMTVSRWELNKTRVDLPILAAVAEAIYGDMAEVEDMLHHPDQPTPNQLMRKLPEDERNSFLKQMQRAAKEAS